MTDEACPCCGNLGSLRLFQRRLDSIGKSVEIVICTGCTALINRTARLSADDPTAEAQMQIDSANIFYERRMNPERLTQNRENLAALDRLLSGALRGRTAVDLGCGEGYLAAAACDRYDRVWAVDINIDLLEEMAPQFGAGDKLRVAASLDAVDGRADAIFMWHTLEHILQPMALGRSISEKLNPGGLFVWQVPAYRDDHVVYSHYTFFNDHAARVFSENIGMEAIAIFHDEVPQFLTVVSRKSEPVIAQRPRRRRLFAFG